MSMNPARTFGSAVVASLWTATWIYFTAPPLGMLAAAELYLRISGIGRVYCAKLDHSGSARCIFHCRFPALLQESRNGKTAVACLAEPQLTGDRPSPRVTPAAAREPASLPPGAVTCGTPAASKGSSDRSAAEPMADAELPASAVQETLYFG
jgi:hypothetical protein